VAAAYPASREAQIRKVRYGVRKGDSLARIAGKFNVRVKDIVSWNNLDASRYLQPGQKLLLYVNVNNGTD
jgi:membrane-bound lytic murein transglycosylase D